MYHSIFSSLTRSKYLSLYWLSLIFALWLVRTAKSSIQPVVNEGAIPLVWFEPELGTYYHYTPTSHTRHTVKMLTILLPFLRAEHTCCLTAAILDFAKGAFVEANRGKNHTLYLYLPELLICVIRITEVIFCFVFSFTVKEGSKKERRPIANRQLLYQSSLLPHFLPHGATVTASSIFFLFCFCFVFFKFFIYLFIYLFLFNYH